jgi:quercetin dioxygenase-like cupin family protein
MTDGKYASQDDTVDASLLGEWADALTPVAPPAGLRAKVLARVSSENAERLRTIRAEEGWVPFMKGIQFKMLYRDETTGARSLLARLEPGVVLPPHEHGFAEECLVLEGEISFGDLTIRAGDYHFAARGARHPALTTRTGALVFLRAGRGEPVPEPAGR